MRGPPPQSDCWSPTNESIYQSPKHFDGRHQSQHPQSHNNIRSTDYDHFSPSIQNAASGVPMFGGYWPLQDLASDGITVPTGLTTTSNAPPTHFQHFDYSHMLHPHDRLHIHYPVAPPPHLEPAFVAAYASQPIPPKPTSQPEQLNQSLLDNEANLEKMRHERELVFEKAATELEQAKCDNGSSVPSNKAWEDAWAILREQMTKM
ncbi:hypothetical protein KCU78_g2014, partial [Aureobasidium melanogenum]